MLLSNLSGGRKISKENEDQWIGGIQATLEALKEQPESVLEVCLSRRHDHPAIAPIVALARKTGVKIREVPRSEIERTLPKLNHQGVAVRRTTFAYTDLVALLEREAPPTPLLVLDEVTDPRNLGAILRSAWAFGVEGVLVPKHRSAGLSSATAKSAAGAIEHVALVRAGNTSQVLGDLKQNGYWVYGAAAEAKTSLAEMDWGEKVAIVFGSEGSGIRLGVRKACDGLFSIPIEPRSGSLNVSVAVGIVLHMLYQGREAKRRRGESS